MFSIRINLPEIQRARHQRTESLGAYDLYLRALPMRIPDNDQALALVALKLDPEGTCLRCLGFRTTFPARRVRARMIGGCPKARALTLGADDAQASPWCLRSGQHYA